VISLFSSGDFMRVTIKPGPSRSYLGAVGLLMGLVVNDQGTIRAIVNGEEGVIGRVDLEDIVSDFVYNVEKDQFEDRSAVVIDEVVPE
jgi:hypothetical protein